MFTISSKTENPKSRLMTSHYSIEMRKSVANAGTI